MQNTFIHNKLNAYVVVCVVCLSMSIGGIAYAQNVIPQWATTELSSIIVQWSTGTLQESQAVGRVRDVIVKLATGWQPPVINVASQCTDGIDNDNDGQTDAIGYTKLQSVPIDLQRPVTLGIQEKTHSLAVQNDKYVIAFTSERPSFSVLNTKNGALVENMKPLFPTPNDRRFERIASMRKKIQNDEFTAEKCDPADAKSKHSVTMYNSPAGYVHIKINTGECTALVLKAYSVGQWVIETVNGSAISNIVIDGYQVGSVTNKNLQDRVIYLSGPFGTTTANTVLSLPNGSGQSPYKAAGLIVGTKDASLEEPEWNDFDMQLWSKRDSIIAEDTVYASFAGITHHEVCTMITKNNTRCKIEAPTDIEGYVVRFDLNSQPVRTVTKKLPEGFSRLEHMVYDKKSNRIFGLMYAHQKHYELVAFDATTLELVAQKTIKPEYTYIQFLPDGSAPNIDKFSVGTIMVTNNAVHVTAMEGLKQYEFQMYSYSLDNLTLLQSKVFTLKSDFGTAIPKMGRVGVMQQMDIDANTIAVMLNVLDTSFKSVQNYLVYINLDTLSISKEVVLSPKYSPIKVLPELQRVIAVGNAEFSIIDYGSTNSRAIASLSGELKNQDIANRIIALDPHSRYLVFKDASGVFKQVALDTGAVSNAQKPAMYPHDFYDYTEFNNNDTLYKIVWHTGMPGNFSLDTYQMCNP